MCEQSFNTSEAVLGGVRDTKLPSFCRPTYTRTDSLIRVYPRKYLFYGGNDEREGCCTA